jgi:uncharacterized protein (TIGR02147 family)
MSIYDFNDYVDFISEYLKNQSNAGHGLLSRWAKKLGVSTTLISQILKRKKSLSLELADGLAKQLELGQKETDYFFLLVELNRAGTASLQLHFKRKIKEVQEASRLLKNRIQNAQELSGEVKTRYYSSWIYSGVRNLAVCEGVETLEELAQRLGLSRTRVSEIIEFLLQSSLLTANKKGWASGISSTYLPSDSPLIAKHHQNWRLKAMQKMEIARTEDLFYTSPMSLSESVARELRKDLVEMIQTLQAKAGPSSSETIRCLSVDWFHY